MAGIFGEEGGRVNGGWMPGCGVWGSGCGYGVKSRHEPVVHMLKEMMFRCMSTV